MVMSINFLKALQDLDLEKDIISNDFEFNVNGDVYMITSTLNDNYTVNILTTEIFYLSSGDVEKIETTYGTAKSIETFRYNSTGDIIGSDITKSVI